jgi:hypothetical protein
MKPNRDASELAARLSGAAAQPLPLPQPITPTLVVPKPPPSAPKPVTQSAPRAAATSEASRKGRPAADTKGITLRPSTEVLHRYTLAAADRTRKEGRVVSAQEIMLERLEDGP